MAKVAGARKLNRRRTLTQTAADIRLIKHSQPDRAAGLAPLQPRLAVLFGGPVQLAT
jgi:hypothetical protein